MGVSEGSVCGRKVDNDVRRQVERQRQIGRRTRDRKRFWEKDRRKEKSK